MTVAILDGDIIAYRQALISTDTYEDTSIFDPLSVKKNIEIMVNDWSTLAKAGKTIVALSSNDHRYFRHQIYPDYKGNRSKTERPPALDCAYQSLKDNFDCVQIDGLEADDIMGIFAGNPDISDPVIVSIDKDMHTVPSMFLNPSKMKRPLKVREPMADRAMLMQALCGDSTDNYKGLVGVGPVKAAALLDQFPNAASAWPTIVEAFGDEEQALLMVRLARILRFDDWNEKEKEIRLWHPTNKDLWMKLTPPITKKETSKPSTTLSQSAKTSQETKQSVSPTPSNTSAVTGKRVRRRKKTLKRRSGTSRSSSKS